MNKLALFSGRLYLNLRIGRFIKRCMRRNRRRAGEALTHDLGGHAWTAEVGYYAAALVEG